MNETGNLSNHFNGSTRSWVGKIKKICKGTIILIQENHEALSSYYKSSDFSPSYLFPYFSGS